MKKLGSMLLVSALGGALTLMAYKLFFEPTSPKDTPVISTSTVMPTSYINNPLSSEETELSFVTAAEQSVHSVVHVKNTAIASGPMSMADLFFGRNREQYRVGTGSGVIISQDGYILTNNHVIEGASALEVVLNDNTEYSAKLIGSDPATDIALLKIEAAESLPAIVFGDSDATRLGEWVLAVGNPFNLTSTVTAGIVSAKSRDLNEYDGKNQSFIQTDAAVNPGNSGGALVNLRGELIGINTAISTQTGSYIGYSFAIPSNIAKKVVEDLLEYGNVQKGLLGIYSPTGIQNKDTYNGKGVYVSAVVEDSGADKAGIKEGDIIRQIDQVEINKFSDLTGYVDSKRPDEVVVVKLERNGKPMSLSVTLSRPQILTIPQLSIQVKNLSDKDKKEFGTSKGVKIIQAQREILLEKLIVEIDGVEIKDVNQLENLLKQRESFSDLLIVVQDKKGEKVTFYAQ